MSRRCTLAWSTCIALAITLPTRALADDVDEPQPWAVTLTGDAAAVLGPYGTPWPGLGIGVDVHWTWADTVRVGAGTELRAVTPLFVPVFTYFAWGGVASIAWTPRFGDVRILLGGDVQASAIAPVIFGLAAVGVPFGEGVYATLFPGVEVGLGPTVGVEYPVFDDVNVHATLGVPVTAYVGWPGLTLLAPLVTPKLSVGATFGLPW